MMSSWAVLPYDMKLIFALLISLLIMKSVVTSLYDHDCGSPWRSNANHTSNTGIKPNPEAEVPTKNVDIAVVHMITNRIE